MSETKTQAGAEPQATTMDPKRIAVHPLNPRTDATPDPGMVASVREQGVLERLLLAPVPADLPEAARKKLKRGTEYLLIAGHRRRGAAIEAKAKTVPVDIRHDLDTTEKQLAVIAAENIHRSDLSAVEEGDLYLELAGLGLNQAQIAARTSVAKPRISERSRVAKLPTGARDKLTAGQVTLDAALQLAKVDDPDAVARIAKMPSYLWTTEVRKALAEKEARRAYERRRKELTKAGVRVLDALPPTPDVDATDTVPAWVHLDELVDMTEGAVEDLVAGELGIDSDDLTWEQIETWHQACPGHAVAHHTVKDWMGTRTTWSAICTTPAEHDALMPEPATDPAGSPSPTATKADTAKPDTTPADREALAAAAATRRAWLADLLADSNRAGGALWRICKASVDAHTAGRHHNNVLDLQLHDKGHRLMLEILAKVNPPSGVYATSTAVVAAWADHAPQASPSPVLALATIIAGHAPREDYLGTDRREWKSGEYGFAVPWIRTLDAMGYPWSEDELVWLDRAAAPGAAAGGEDE